MASKGTKAKANDEKQTIIGNFFKKKEPQKLWTEVKPLERTEKKIKRKKSITNTVKTNVQSNNFLDLTEDSSLILKECNHKQSEQNKDYLPHNRKLDRMLITQTLDKPKINVNVLNNKIPTPSSKSVNISLNESDIIPPTPESVESICVSGVMTDDNKVVEFTTPHTSLKLKSKLIQINAASKKLQMKKMKLDSLITTPVVTPKITKTLEEKKMSSSKKLSLTKPRKRRCNFSPSDGSKQFDKKPTYSKDNSEVLMKGPACTFVDDDENDEFLKGYTTQNTYAEKNSVEQMTLVKNKKTSNCLVNNISLSDSFLIGLDNEPEGITENKVEVPEAPCTSALDDSLFDNIEFDNNMLLEPKEEPFLLVWEVTDVRTSSYEHSSGYTTKENILTMQVRKQNLLATCHLRDDWCHMEVEVTDLAFVSGLSSTKHSCILDNKSIHHITLFPNTLISGTTIATAITCERQAVLDQQFKLGDQNQAMLLGSLTHDLFQWALQNKNFSIAALEKKAREDLQSIGYLEAMYAIGTDETEMISKIREYFTPIQEWYNSFVSCSKGKRIEFKTGRTSNSHDSNVFLHVDDITDIEENIWAPIYGLKGKIDVSVNVTVHRQPKLQKSQEKYKLPLELKTGKMFSKLGSIEHRAQVAVYTLLMSEKYNELIDTGLLYYIKTNHMQGIPRPEQEKRAIIIKRNEIARKLTLERKRFTLPGLLRNARQCKRCYQNSTCMLCYKALDKGEAWTSGVNELFTELTAHLTERDTSYFQKWYRLCLLETSYSVLKNKERFIWKTSAKEREKLGHCFSQMIIINEDQTSDGKLHYRFRRSFNHFNANVSLHKTPLTVGDRVIISEENLNVFNITTGYITSVSSEDIVISVHHTITPTQNATETLYRIDKDDTLSNYTTQLSNVCLLFTKDSNRDAKLRKLVVHGDAPIFSEEKADDLACTQLLALKGSNDSFKATQGQELNNIFSRLNQAQKAAIERCLVADDYVLILGMPGAGKSTTTACLVRSLVSMGKSVLLTSYTHSAVDTILMKLLEVDFHKFLRLGQKSRIHSKILPYSSYEGTKNLTTTNQLRDFYNSQTVVATTCLGLQHPIFKHKSFDYCIVDEASQITQPVCIGPIRYANAFILVGDHNQLPPLVQCEEARDSGLDISLFRALSELHPEAVVTLDRQYRMNDAIMMLTNQLIYENRMKCGNEAIATAILNLPMYKHVCDELRTDQLLDVINPEQSVVFLNTDEAGLKETKTEAHLVNTGEAVLVKSIIEMLLKCGLTHRDIGVISPYRHQLKVIRQELKDISTLSSSAYIEVDTIDKYQGKDKSCIIVSLVRSNGGKEVGDLLKDWRRINVAITRAKHKLILIGSRKTVIMSETFRKLIQIIDHNQWCITWRQGDGVIKH